MDSFSFNNWQSCLSCLAFNQTTFSHISWHVCIGSSVKIICAIIYRCVVVEDSAIGLAAAKAAGMKCIVTKSG